MMKNGSFRGRAAAAAIVAACAALSGPSMAQGTTTGGAAPAMPATAPTEAAREAMNLVSQSSRVVQRMEQDDGMRDFLQQARGVFLVPNYGRAALVLGGRGGEGVLMVRQNGQWSEPLFYNLGGISIGLQAGVEAGDVAFVLNNQRAVDNFLQRNNWSLDAHAGLTVGTWAGKAQADAGRGDITIWTDAAGISGNLAVSIANINFDQEETYAYYGRQVAVQDVVGGRVTNPHSRILQQTLAAVAGPTATGAAATGAGAAGSGASGYGHQGGQQDMAPSR